MDQTSIQRALTGIPIGPIRFLPQVGSTNDAALDWMEAGAPDLALVVADEQTSGRGRAGRSWFTPPGAALALSFGLILDTAETGRSLARYTAFGALAAAGAVEALFPQPARIKWPNDVLVEGRKLAGVLAEARWTGNRLAALTVGIGINIAPNSVPPAGQIDFPAIALETAVGQPVDRLEVLRSLALEAVHWRKKIASQEFLSAWESRLAYRGRPVRIESQDRPPLEGVLLGLNPEGAVRLALPDGRETAIRVGNLQLRPLNSE